MCVDALTFVIFHFCINNFLDKTTGSDRFSFYIEGSFFLFLKKSIPFKEQKVAT